MQGQTLIAFSLSLAGPLGSTHSPRPRAAAGLTVGTPARFPGSSSSTATNPREGQRDLQFGANSVHDEHHSQRPPFVFYGLKIDMFSFG